LKESASSKNWKRRQARDPFVKKAQKENYRARSAYKLEELDKNFNLFARSKVVIDLGSAPGAWTQYAIRRSEQLSKKIKLIALDLLEMPYIPEIDFFQGDFTDEAIKQKLKLCLADQKAHLILSDMAPNMSGVRSVDDGRAINLCEEVVEFANDCLSAEGNLICKSFHGAYFEDFLSVVKKNYHKTHCFKPQSSRPQSREIYVVGLSKK
jgi:23S rRNA (uridine2552-2'-O)-methyltransferase